MSEFLKQVKAEREKALKEIAERKHKNELRQKEENAKKKKMEEEKIQTYMRNFRNMILDAARQGLGWMNLLEPNTKANFYEKQAAQRIADEDNMIFMCEDYTYYEEDYENAGLNSGQGDATRMYIFWDENEYNEMKNRRKMRY